MTRRVRRKPSPRRVSRLGVRVAWMLLLGAGSLLGGCALLGGGPPPPDQRYGHRYDAAGPDGYPVRTLASEAPSQAYFYYAAPVHEVAVRDAEAETRTDTSTVRAEVLVKGGMPEPCMELSDVSQRRAGHLIEMELQLRKLRGATCEMGEQLYRVYLPLEGRFREGAYTLLLNGDEYPFTIDIDD